MIPGGCVKLLLYFLTLFIYDAQIMQEHTGIVIKDLQDKSGLHIDVYKRQVSDMVRASSWSWVT